MTACACHPRALPAAICGEEPRPDPWLYSEGLDVPVYLRADLGTRWGQTVWRDGVPEIHLAYDLGKIQRRCTLGHELVHVSRGAPCRPLCREDEAATVEATARWLLPDLGAVARQLAHCDMRDAAEDLSVTRNVLTDRIDSLTEVELRTFGELLAEAAEDAPQVGPCRFERPLARRPARLRDALATAAS